MRKKKKCLKCGYWNAAEAAFCNLCYEPFNKAAPKENSALPAPPPAGPGRARPLKGRLPLVLAAAALLALAGWVSTRFLTSPRQAEGGAAARVNRFSDKTGAADKLLNDYIQAKENLLAGIAAGPLEPEGFGIAGAYTVKLFAIEEAYSAAISALELPASSAADPAADAPYLEWEELHRRRETAAMEDFGVRYGKLAQKAAGAGG